jgi:hypothetical protein
MGIRTSRWRVLVLGVGIGLVAAVILAAVALRIALIGAAAGVGLFASLLSAEGRANALGVALTFIMSGTLAGLAVGAVLAVLKPDTVRRELESLPAGITGALVWSTVNMAAAEQPPSSWSAWLLAYFMAAIVGAVGAMVMSEPLRGAIEDARSFGAALMVGAWRIAAFAVAAHGALIAAPLLFWGIPALVAAALGHVSRQEWRLVALPVLGAAGALGLSALALRAAKVPLGRGPTDAAGFAGSSSSRKGKRAPRIS